MKGLIIYSLMTVVIFVVNFAIFNYSFNMQATPFLHEEQRVDSGLLMLKTTVPAYAIASVLITMAFYLVAEKCHKGEIRERS